MARGKRRLGPGAPGFFPWGGLGESGPGRVRFDPRPPEAYKNIPGLRAGPLQATRPYPAWCSNSALRRRMEFGFDILFDLGRNFQSRGQRIKVAPLHKVVNTGD